MKYEAFSYEEFLKGRKVFTRAGDEVTQLIKFEGAEDNFCLGGVLDAVVQTWRLDGKFTNRDEDSQTDLVLAKEEKVRFMAIYENSGFCTLEDSKKCGDAALGYLEINYDTETVKFHK